MSRDPKDPVEPTTAPGSVEPVDAQTRLREELAAYALGALGDVSRAHLEGAVASSPELQLELRELSEVTALLALSAPARTPPPALRSRILADASAARLIRSASSARGAGAGSNSSAATSSGPRGIVTMLPWLLAAAALVGVVIQQRSLGSERAARLAAEASLAGTRREVASLDSLVATLTASDLSTVTLASTGAPPSARLYWNRVKGEVVLAAFRLPPAAAGRTYQLWGIATGQAPVSLGTFTSAGEGRAVVRFAMPPGLQLAVGAVTEEPAGGSPQPTSAPFLAGTVRATE